MPTGPKNGGRSLAKVDTIVFDKTGTLTLGKPRVSKVAVVGASMSDADLVILAAAADRRSGHPLAKAVVDYAAELKFAIPEPVEFEVLRGRGVKATVNGKHTLVGNAALLQESGIVLPPATQTEEKGHTTVFVAADGVVCGMLFIVDQIRPGAKEALAQLKANGIKRIVMLTGDNRAVAEWVAAELGVDEIQAELLPEAKVKAIQALQQKGCRVAMVGDGVNDAPALAMADMGIAMGVGGTQAAIEAADIALMTDDLSKIVTARLIARRAYRTIKENLFVGVGVVHVLGITAALLGLIGPIEAAVIHLGPDVLVFLNSVKLLRVKLT